ncbi:MAG: alpha/beta hydrolase, partial [Siphonobacter sp.]
MKKIVFILLSTMTFANAQQVIPLYDFSPIPNQAPNAPVTDEAVVDNGKNDGILRLNNITKPSITLYKTAKPNGTAVIICPGGGYGILAASHEGSDVAKVFNEWGITAFVLKYRLPSTKNLMVQNEIGPLMDAQQAIRMVRSRASEFGIKPDRIGIMGFSAGGHLASTAGTHFENPVGSWPNRPNVSVRPDFQILIYPVISLTPELAHGGSRDALLGKDASQDKIDAYSNEKQVTRQTPPSFLVHAQDDKAVNPQNSIAFFTASQNNGVASELHIYPKGGH